MRLVILLAALSCAGASLANPPRATVVEDRLLPRAAKQSVARLASRGTAAQGDTAMSLERVRALLAAGRADGDPRTLGYAEALLDSASGPTRDIETEVLRATIEQARHQFDAARVRLDAVLAHAPRHPQALLTRATIATVTGRYDAAAADCRALAAVQVDTGILCAAQVAAVTGGEARAAQVVALVAGRTDGALRAWALALRGQLAEQAGDPRTAIAAYRDSLRHADDLSTRLALADALLDTGEYDTVLALLQDAAPADGVLLRRWLAARGRRADDAATQARLTQRIEEARARGDFLHAREAAMFALARGQVAQAQAWARTNWQAQREPADLLVLARAAVAAGDRASLRDIEQWLRTHGLRDRRIERVLGGARAQVGTTEGRSSLA